MYVISRFEQFIEYWWTGVQWTIDKDQAKRFGTQDQARQEMSDKKIQYSYSVTPA